MFTKTDIKHIKDRGSSISEIENQIENFEKGFPFLPIVDPATIGMGIIQIDEEGLDGYIDLYDKAVGEGLELLKFIPASGAASRMFKDLFSFREKAANNSVASTLIELPENENVKQFFDRIADFAFYGELIKSAGRLNDENGNTDYCNIIDSLLTDKGLNYGFLPKGLIKFHDNKPGICTPVYEHMVEAAEYCTDLKGNANLHFTVSPEHKGFFIEETAQVASELEKKYGIAYNISFSVQKPSTDTIAVGLENKPFRQEDGTILFRPGGHGALLDNLNNIPSDIIFIKNIDNVVPDKLKGTTVRFKKALAGILLTFRGKIFRYLEQLEKPVASIPDGLLVEISDFLENDICIQFDTNFVTQNKNDLVKYIQGKLNRPIRVCGMVKNEGEPGGGPFIAKNADGTLSLQIVEESQIDKSNPEQADVFRRATHFNPVDLVCGIKDYKGKRFDMLKYRDPETGFISRKSKDGRILKAQELPGLWNGAMSDWNTLFVEVPVITFNPVKTVNDLLRNEHQ